MTRDDYFKWADEYKQQVDILNEKIKEKEKLLRSKTVKERWYQEHSLQILYDMRNDCLNSYGILRKRAENIND